MKPKIAALGGSIREQIVIDSLRNKGAYVSSFATEKPCHNDAKSPEDALQNASALILPIRSNHNDLTVKGTSEKCPLTLSESMLRRLKNDAVIYCGIGSDALRNMAHRTKHPLKEIMEEDAVALPNAILTAEGTLAHIMEHSRRSMRNIFISILGYGRVGKACAALFSSVGCRVVVFCRSEESMRHGREKGFDMRYYNGVAAVFPQTDYLINTVPAKIINQRLLSYLPPGGYIIDLASAPGGVDMDAAEKYRFPIAILSGLPEKYAPISAGSILTSYYTNTLTPLLGGGFQ